MMAPIARAAFVLAALVSLLPPLIAQAQPGAPVAVSACNVLPWHSTGPYPYWNPFLFHGLGAGAPATDGIHIAFVNQSPLVADRVAFRVDYRGEVER